ncbi:anti-anti-sigma factor [Legionella birminghamensis]|uniref:Anti-anti-sigma factor n=1 Tax=Legionella birminghamensis TaxID=28083 RepID=A0A378IBT0_9GAMM|nr:STAS domain-containing protein [Legionella birminghamensis]KTC67758.1 anti-anti-sigma factor [Legionella birminghamensis]STX32021.1 anti-anti-sigma factor [Legionella birminghamensis]
MTDFVFEPASRMTFATVDADIKRLAGFYRNTGQGSIIINLQAVQHCDSAGLALLIEAKRLAKRFNRPCRFTGMSRQLAALAEFCRVNNLLAGE